MRKVVIVGGVAGGASAAARLRRLDETAEIILFEKDEHISFANCGLPYHIGETITERSKLIVQSPAAMKSRFNIDVRTNSRVAGINPAAKTVRVISADRGAYDESYDALVLAPGVEPIALPARNACPELVMSLRTIPDMDRIKAAASDGRPKTAAVIGGGYIGVEVAENLCQIGVETTLVEAAPHILAPFDSEFSVLAEQELAKHGVRIILNDMLEAVDEADGQAILTLRSGQTLQAGLVVSAIGVTPATGFLKDSGVALSPRGHIIVDDRMRTNLPDIYAAGDAVEVIDFITGRPAAIPLAGPANKQGRIAADQICGIDHRYGGTQGTSIIKVFGLTAASTGANERTLRQLGIACTAIWTHPFSHATYYPGAAQMSCKLLFDQNGKILGCQIVGTQGVDKRIDVVATAIRLGGTVFDLCDLELAYAPPFSSAKDPVNMLGYIAQNILEGRSNIASWSEVANRDPESTILLDVRTPGEFARGHIAGAVNIPVDELRGRLDEIDPEKQVLEYCQVGLRGHVAERILTQHGRKVKNLSGGWKTYSTI